MSAADDFLAEFAKVTGTGSFHSFGTCPFFLPEIHVDGVGELAFPLPPAQAKALSACAEAAPYGKGEKTVLDEKVRKCWQIDAARIEFRSPEWRKFLKRIAERIREDLGIGGRISLHSYKLLLYGKGGHFRAHRDTEKLGAMIGSLIVALPSAHQGGVLLIRHDSRKVEIDFSDEAHSREFQYAAFFADCEHEVQPVRSGWRCCLAYNLRLDQGDPSRLNLSVTAQSRALLPSVAALKNERAGELTAVLLEHHYTEANLSWRNLKGNDPSKAQALAAAAQEAGCVAHLALVTFHQMGELEGTYGYSRYRDDDPEDGTMGEVYEESLSIGHWRDARDRPVPLGSYAIERDAMVSREKIDAADPDEKEAEGYTGNAGCTMDYWYRRAAIVLWREEDGERIRARYDLDGACKRLADLARKGRSEPAFRRLAEAIIDRYPEALPRYFPRHRDNFGSNFAITLKALATAGARELFELLAARVPATAFHLCDTPLWKTLHKAFGSDVCERLVERTDGEETEEHRRMLFDLLDALRTKKDAIQVARRIAERLVALAPAPKPPAPWDQPAEPMAPGRSDETRILLAASYLIDSNASRNAALAFILADRSLIYVRKLLGPVLLDKSLKTSASQPNSLIPQALAFAREALEAEIARPLEPYPDWSRPFPDSTDAGAPLIRELAAFVADPAAETHSFKCSEGYRSQIEGFIRRHQLDLDCTTVKSSRPYSLVCTKNDKSYRRKLALRAAEIELTRKLAGL